MFPDSLNVPSESTLQVTAGEGTDGAGSRVLTPTKTTICPAADLTLKKDGDKMVIPGSTGEQHSNYIAGNRLHLWELKQKEKRRHHFVVNHETHRVNKSH